MNDLQNFTRRFRLVACLTALLGIAFAGAASAQPLDPNHAAKMARGVEVFKAGVRETLTKRCLNCHGGKRTESEFDLTDRDEMLKGGVMGKAVVPGQHQKSLLWQMTAHVKEPEMPYGDEKIPQKEIDQLALWIDLGAPYDKPLIDRKQATAWMQKVTPESAKQHWAYQPLKPVAVPPVRQPGWARNPIDAFILAKQEAKGLKPNPPASRAQIIRRMAFDLTGLPPTPAQVQSFVNDPAPDAEALGRVVDALLASPAYGERWGRHWLDLARFAESHGFEHDYDRPYAYHYRDFVIEALNQDLPYDQFVRWQLAGDEIAPQNPLAMKATGFLAAGVHSTQITANEVEKHRYDELDDMLATTGTAMLGLTFGCARCHDHKYDAIPQRDYYQMLATFTTTVRSDLPVDTDPVGYAKRMAEFDAAHAPFLAKLAEYEAKQLPAQFAAWEQASKGKVATPWKVFEFVDAKSGGSTLTRQPDGIVVASGKNPPIETFTLTAVATGEPIRAVRLEALKDAALVAGGPGRAGNGNFCLTNFALTVIPTPEAAKAGATSQSVKFATARATFDQKGLPIVAAIDPDPTTSGWAIDPKFGQDHAAIFDLAEPLTVPPGTKLVFQLNFHNNVGHNIARSRLSFTSQPSQGLDLQGQGMPAQVVSALAQPADKRSPEQVKALLNWFKPQDSEWVKLDQARESHAKNRPSPSKVTMLVSSEGVPAVRLHTQGADFLDQTHFLKRGDVNQKEGVATQSFLQALMPSVDAANRWQTIKPKPGEKLSYRRTAFANWLTDVEAGAGKLLARVIVNRLWQHHFGRGIVATSSDFGVRGEPPTHPELLDWLANELIRNGWRLKPIHKLMLLSATYSQSSTNDAEKLKIDRENQLLWRITPRRLEAEVIRDNLLAVSGMIDPKMFGPGTLDENSLRRSIYFTVKRSKLISSLIIFDAPDGSVGVGDRATTTIAPQALHLMNNPQVRNAAKKLAERVAPKSEVPIEEAVTAAYWLALSRPPSAEERADAIAFIADQQASYGTAADARQRALTDYCQVIFCLNEFVYLE